MRRKKISRSDMDFSLAEKYQKESWRLNRKFMIEESWIRNMFSRSNMDYCMADVTSEGINEYIHI